MVSNWLLTEFNNGLVLEWLRWIGGGLGKNSGSAITLTLPISATTYKVATANIPDGSNRTTYYAWFKFLVGDMTTSNFVLNYWNAHTGATAYSGCHMIVIGYSME